MNKCLLVDLIKKPPLGSRYNRSFLNTPYNIDNITVYDAYGKVVLVTTSIGQSGSINLEGFSKGLYTIVINTDKGLGTKKIMLQ
jgi:hypothetical protein